MGCLGCNINHLLEHWILERVDQLKQEKSERRRKSTKLKHTWLV
jgi:hypothetical protein